MEIDVDESGQVRLKKVFNPIILKTEEGNSLSLCMRDGDFEIRASEGTRVFLTLGGVPVEYSSDKIDPSALKCSCGRRKPTYRCIRTF